MLDLYECDKEKLVDIKLIYKILDELPSLLGMRKVIPPYVIPYKGSDNPEHFDKGGVSGVVIIAESHISIHTFVAQGYANMDIFSCKNFDAEKATKYLAEVFGAKKIEKKFLMRGKEFSRDLEEIKQAVAKKV
jgi:S-adenosylmethionine decarboxylase